MKKEPMIMTDAKFLHDVGKLVKEVEMFRNDYNMGQKYDEDVKLSTFKRALKERQT